MNQVEITESECVYYLGCKNQFNNQNLITQIQSELCIGEIEMEYANVSLSNLINFPSTIQSERLSLVRSDTLSSWLSDCSGVGGYISQNFSRNNSRNNCLNIGDQTINLKPFDAEIEISELSEDPRCLVSPNNNMKGEESSHGDFNKVIFIDNEGSLTPAMDNQKIILLNMPEESVCSPNYYPKSIFDIKTSSQEHMDKIRSYSVIGNENDRHNKDLTKLEHINHLPSFNEFMQDIILKISERKGKLKDAQKTYRTDVCTSPINGNMIDILDLGAKNSAKMCRKDVLKSPEMKDKAMNINWDKTSTVLMKDSYTVMDTNFGNENASVFLGHPDLDIHINDKTDFNITDGNTSYDTAFSDHSGMYTNFSEERSANDLPKSKPPKVTKRSRKVWGSTDSMESKKEIIMCNSENQTLERDHNEFLESIMSQFNSMSPLVTEIKEDIAKSFYELNSYVSQLKWMTTSQFRGTANDSNFMLIMKKKWIDDLLEGFIQTTVSEVKFSTHSSFTTQTSTFKDDSSTPKLQSTLGLMDNAWKSLKNSCIYKHLSNQSGEQSEPKIIPNVLLNMQASQFDIEASDLLCKPDFNEFSTSIDVQPQTSNTENIIYNAV